MTRIVSLTASLLLWTPSWALAQGDADDPPVPALPEDMKVEPAPAPRRWSCST